MVKRRDIFRRCSGLTSEFFGLKIMITVSLSLFLCACQFLADCFITGAGRKVESCM